MARQGQLIDRGDRTWLVRVYLGRDGYGKRRYLNQTVHGSKKEAQRALTARLRAKDTGALAEPTRQTLGAWLDEWLARHRHEIGPRTYVDYTGAIERHIRPALGSIRLAKLSAADIQGLVTAMLERGLKPNTIRLNMAPLRASLRAAVKLGKLARDPAEHVTRPRVVRAERTVLGPAEAARLLAMCEADEQWGAMIEVLLMTGLRPGELRALRWSDIDGATVRVQRALVRTDDGWEMREPKTPRARRAIDLSDVERRALARQRRYVAQLRLAAGAEWNDADLVFPTSSGRPQDPADITTRVLPRLLHRAGLPPMRLYDLRHSMATLMLAAGVSPKVVSERLGHSTVAMTLNTYSHVLPAMQREAAETLARLVSAAMSEVAT